MASISSLCCWKSKNFLLQCHSPRLLVKSRWPCKAFLFLLYRLATAAYFLSMSLWIVSTSYKFWVYLTYWNYLLITVAFVVQAVSAVVFYNWLHEDINDEESSLLNQSVEVRTIPVILEISWLLLTTSIVASLCNVFIYWIFILPITPELFYIDYATHGPNAALILLDIILCARPVRMEHFYMPVCWFLLYYAFTAFYWAGGGLNKDGERALYEDLEWSNVGSIFTSFFETIGIAFGSHIIGYCVALGRDYVWLVMRVKKTAKDEISIVLENEVQI